jgi:CDP-paratose 2-epimerase
VSLVSLSDQKMFVADVTKAKALLDWEPGVDKNNGIKMMLNWIIKE